MSGPAIFLDSFSTTPPDKRVVDVMAECMLRNYGNASSSDHVFGEHARHAVELARKHVGRLIGAERAKVAFTSGATESINIVVQHIVSTVDGGRVARIALSPVEHAAVLETCIHLKAEGKAELEFLEVDRQGCLKLTSLSRALSRQPDLVCVMAANNETGNVFPTEEISKLCAEAGAKFLCDATQAVGKIPMKFDDWEITYLVLSAHKFYGPKGVGGLVFRRKNEPSNLVWGGAQEYGVRPGTLNVAGIVGLGEAARLRQIEMIADEKEIADKRDRLQGILCKALPEMVLNGDQENRLSGALHFSIPGIANGPLIARMGARLAISRGAACSSGVEAPSHVLKAMGLEDNIVESAIRIGVNKFNSYQDIEEAAHIFVEAVQKVKTSMNSQLEEILK